MKIAEFDWDAGNLAKCQRHGVSLAEIERLLSGNPRVAPDVIHSNREERFIAVGRTSTGRAIFVAFTFRTMGERRMIRPISARFMHNKESRTYGQEGAEAEDR